MNEDGTTAVDPTMDPAAEEKHEEGTEVAAEEKHEEGTEEVAA